jgi:hypothetical protein
MMMSLALPERRLLRAEVGLATIPSSAVARGVTHSTCSPE